MRASDILLPVSVPNEAAFGPRVLTVTTPAGSAVFPGAVTVVPGPLEAFVIGFYDEVLGRHPARAEVRSWVDFLRQNPTPDGARQLVQGFFNSMENLNRPMTLADYVRSLYHTILQREPAASEVQAWIDIGMLPIFNSLVPGFVRSPEFQRLLQSTPASLVVSRLYQNVLGRMETPSENAAWVAYLVRTGDWEGVAIGFLDSPEYLSGRRSLADHVTILYRTFLGRDPEPAGLSAWLAFLASRLGAIQLGFTFSPEFQNRAVQLFR